MQRSCRRCDWKSEWYWPASIQCFAAEGLRVVIADVEESCLRQGLKRKDASVLGVVTNISEAESVENLAHKTVEGFGVVHICVAILKSGLASIFRQPRRRNGDRVTTKPQNKKYLSGVPAG